MSLILVTLLHGMATAQTQQFGSKAFVEYSGSTFLMSDGCPPPQCDVRTRDCARTQMMVEALYHHCCGSDDGQRMGCVRAQLGGGEGGRSRPTTLIIPVYMSMCSAMCHEPDNLGNIVPCPYPGLTIGKPTSCNKCM